MPIKFDVADKIPTSSYMRIASIDKSTPGFYEYVKIYGSRPLGISGYVECEVARKIAEKYGVQLAFQDFSRGEDEPSNLKHVFGVTCKEEDQLKTAVKRIENAVIALDAVLRTFVWRIGP